MPSATPQPVPPPTIRSRFAPYAELWSGEAGTIAEAVKKALRGGADLSGADLTGANLAVASLAGANLWGADQLRSAKLDVTKADVWAILDLAPAEAPGLLLALRKSRVDGSVYEGECACLVGTIANVRGCHYEAIPGLVPSAPRAAERWFLAINPFLSVKHPVVALTIEWIEEWRALRDEVAVAAQVAS